MSGNWAFMAAALVLLVAAVGWNSALGLLGWTFRKYPVPAPRAEVSEHRATTFSGRLEAVEAVVDGERVVCGPFVRAKDGEIRSQAHPKPDGVPDGIGIFDKHLLEELGVLKSEYNWYYTGIYRHGLAPRLPRREHGLIYPLASYTRMSITYYTGLLDAVPHVGDQCIAAAGGRVEEARSGKLKVRLTAEDVPEAWREFEVYRTAYVDKNNVFSVQYHVFSMNGEPTWDWKKVRGRLILPNMKYCYFAKIQVASLAPNQTVEQYDQECIKFLQAALPETLRILPSPEDVERLEKTGGTAQVD
jgi:hypothetical protein